MSLSKVKDVSVHMEDSPLLGANKIGVSAPHQGRLVRLLAAGAALFMLLVTLKHDKPTQNKSAYNFPASIQQQGSAVPDVVLSQKIMALVQHSAELSALAYENDPKSKDMGAPYDIQVFIDEPDEALVAKRDGYCFGAFRGTTLTLEDWRQNIRLGKEPICDKDGVCCETRQGFFDAYMTPYHEPWEKAMRACAATCTNPMECVVLTGHSQGGSIAAVASVALADLAPLTITFGQPYTLDFPCARIDSERFYRFINTEGDDDGIVYDPVSFIPGLGADAFGHTIILSNDHTGVAYIGLDAQDYFSPLDLSAAAHNMQGTEEYPGYLDRVNTLVESGSFPIRNDGYVAGSLCSDGKECQSGICESETTWANERCVGVECTADSDCDTGRCDSGICLPKLGSCQTCDEDTDCKGGRCLGFPHYVCSGPEGLMDTNCACNFDRDCRTGKCEGILDFTCEALSPPGARCNEDSDCQSGSCSWWFSCN
mmetsp:Transcript_5956/g.8422  ORF Transcript_5956/g.8422 Transcript_5956/m.8422 type:complete len:483 (+) Transcript_5956:112-1560(+)